MIEKHDEHANGEKRKKGEERFLKELYYYLTAVLGMQDDLTEREKKELGIE